MRCASEIRFTCHFPDTHPFDGRSNPDLTPPAEFATFRSMKALIQTGSSGRVPVPHEKRFLINGYFIENKFDELADIKETDATEKRPFTLDE